MWEYSFVLNTSKKREISNDETIGRIQSTSWQRLSTTYWRMVSTLLTSRVGLRYVAVRCLAIGGTFVGHILRVKIRISSLVLRIFIIPPSILMNSTDSIAWIGIIHDHYDAVCERVPKGAAASAHMHSVIHLAQRSFVSMLYTKQHSRRSFSFPRCFLHLAPCLPRAHLHLNLSLMVTS